MKFTHRRAVSPIIASLLLIAIAVAAGIIVYVYVNSLAGNLTGGGGNQQTQQIQLQTYAFFPLGAHGFTSSGTSGSGQVLDAFLENVGSSSVVINAVYFDGTQLTEWGAGTYLAHEEVPTGTAFGCYELLPSSATAVAQTASQGSGVTGLTTACVNGTPGNCHESNAFCIDASSQTETGGSAASPLAAQTTTQLVIGINWGSLVTQGTSHTIKIVTATGGQAVFTVVAGRSG